MLQASVLRHFPPHLRVRASLFPPLLLSFLLCRAMREQEGTDIGSMARHTRVPIA